MLFIKKTQKVLSTFIFEETSDSNKKRASDVGNVSLLPKLACSRLQHCFHSFTSFYIDWKVEFPTNCFKTMTLTLKVTRGLKCHEKVWCDVWTLGLSRNFQFLRTTNCCPWIDRSEAPIFLRILLFSTWQQFRSLSCDPVRALWGLWLGKEVYGI